MKLSNTFKKIAGLLLLIICGFLFLYYLGFRDVEKKIVHSFELNEQILTQEKRHEYMKSIEREVGEASGDINVVNNAIVSADNDVEFIETLEAVAHKYNLEVTIDSLVLEDKPELTEKHMALLKIRAKTKGNWSGTYNFLKEIEGLPYKIKIDQFEMEGSKNEQGGDPKKKPEQVWQAGVALRVLKYK